MAASPNITIPIDLRRDEASAKAEAIESPAMFVSRSVVAWAAERGVPRSEAFRLLAYRGLALPAET